MGFDRIIALDLGKFNSIACPTDVATRRHAFAAVGTTPQKMHDFLVARRGRRRAGTGSAEMLSKK